MFRTSNRVLYTALFAIILAVISAFSAKAAPPTQELEVTEVAVGTPISLSIHASDNSALATTGETSSDVVEMAHYWRDKDQYQIKLFEMAREIGFTAKIDYHVWMTDNQGNLIEGTTAKGTTTLEGDDINVTSRIHGPIDAGNQIHSRSMLNGVPLPPLDFTIGDESQVRMSLKLIACQVVGYFIEDPFTRMRINTNVYPVEHLTDARGTTQATYPLDPNEPVAKILWEAFSNSELTGFMGGVYAEFPNPCHIPPTSTPSPTNPPVNPSPTPSPTNPPVNPSPTPSPTNPPSDETGLYYIYAPLLQNRGNPGDEITIPTTTPTSPSCIPGMTATFVDDTGVTRELKDGDKWYADNRDLAGKTVLHDNLVVTLHVTPCTEKAVFYSFYPESAILPAGTIQSILHWDAVYMYTHKVYDGMTVEINGTGRFGFGIKDAIHGPNWDDNVSFQVNVFDN